MSLLHELFFGDLFGLIVLSLIVNIVGKVSSQNQQAVRFWARSIATLATIVILVFVFSEDTFLDIYTILDLTIRGLAVGIAINGGLCLLLPPIGVVWIATNSANQRLRLYAERQREKRRQRRKQSAEDKRRRKQRPLLKQQEQRLREQEAKDNAQRAEHTRRKQNARAVCEILYLHHEPIIATRFSRQQFDNFVEKFLSDELTADLVESRAEALQQLIEDHRQAVQPTPKFSVLSDLAIWFEDQKQQIESLPVSDLYKQEYLVRLNERYAEMAQELLESS